MMLTGDELRAVRYYIGDTEGADSFWSESKAYLVINSLFYPDIESEAARAKEGKFLNPEILSDAVRLESLLVNLLSVFQKNRAAKDIETFRVERYSDYLLSKLFGRTVSFTSTSTKGFLNSYFERSGIALMRFRIKKGTPVIDMADVLDEYKKSEESEILLPPFLKLNFTEASLTDDELKIIDSEGKPPVLSCFAETGEMSIPFDNAEYVENGNVYGMKVLDDLNNRRIPNAYDVEIYGKWKKYIVSKVFSGGFSSFC